jgi:hypothetical protein
MITRKSLITLAVFVLVCFIVAAPSATTATAS